VEPSDPIPLSFYEEYWDELPRLSLPVQAHLKTFLELVGFDPDDAGLLDACRVPRVRFRRVYAYELTEGYSVYWRVKREWPMFLSIRSGPPCEVEILAIERP
jgi:hypothetical protein